MHARAGRALLTLVGERPAAAPPTLSLVIPTYNQRERTRRSLIEAKAFLEAQPFDVELIVVDDGSAPGEGSVPEDMPSEVQLLRLPRNQGKGGALRAGILHSKGQYVIFTDSDLPFTLEPLPTTLAWLREGADMVIGDRLHPDSEAAADVTRARRLSSAIFTFLVSGIAGLDLPDTQCGYKGYRGDLARELFATLETTSFAFEIEIIVRALRRGARLRRQPVHLTHNEDTSVRLSKHAPRMALDTLRIAWRAARGKYG
jgi:dolichyl-phosphate beta-glucosyltransferase